MAEVAVSSTVSTKVLARPKSIGICRTHLAVIGASDWPSRYSPVYENCARVNERLSLVVSCEELL